MTLDELKAQVRWMNWRFVLKPGTEKATKVPLMPSGSAGRSNDACTWSAFVTCDAVRSQFDGVGLATGNGIVSVDLDDVLTNGTLSPEARVIVRLLDSYTEISPSGTGLLVLVQASLSGPGIPRPLSPGSQIEIKSEGFFHTFTGSHWEGTPVDVMPRQAEIDALYSLFAGPPPKFTGDGVARPGVQEKFVRRFSAFCERVGIDVTDVRTLADGKVLILTNPCALHDDHDGGVGITADGIRCVQCFHGRCSVGWAQWAKAVEQKHGPMRLDGEIRWKK